MSFSKDGIVLSPAKLYNEDFFIKPIRLLINTLNSNGPGPILEEPQRVVFEMCFACYLH